LLGRLHHSRPILARDKSEYFWRGLANWHFGKVPSSKSQNSRAANPGSLFPMLLELGTWNLELSRGSESVFAPIDD
jgi:hypothetical protein